jgi:hypothetical protein
MIKALTVCVQYKDTGQRASQSVSRRRVCLALPNWGQSKSRVNQGELAMFPTGQSETLYIQCFDGFPGVLVVFLKLNQIPHPTTGVPRI